MRTMRSTSIIVLTFFGAMSGGCEVPVAADESDAPRNVAQLPAQLDSAPIVKAVQEKIVNWLAGIPAKQEEDYGFQTRDEFDKATALDPYQMVSIGKDGTLTELNVWQVPVSVDGRFRLLAEVQGSEKQGYEIVAIGSAVLADELNAVESKRGKAAGRKAILRSAAHLSDFVVFDAEPREVKENRSRAVQPLNSARVALGHKGQRLGMTDGALDEAPLTFDEVVALLAD